MYSSLPETQLPSRGDKGSHQSFKSQLVTVTLAIVAGTALGLGLVSYQHESRLLSIPLTTGSTMRSGPTFRRDMSVYASRQQKEAVDKFKQTGLRPGREARDPEANQAPYKGKSVTADSASLSVHNFDGEVTGQAEMALKVARPETAKGLVHRYLMYARNSMRAGTASTKTRGEVRGGGKKPYAQKKTGNARMGSKRTPLRPGGGVIFGPRPRDWSVDMNQKERRIAMATALQSAQDDIIVIEDLDSQFSEIKTKNMQQFLSRVGTKPAEDKILLVVSGQKRNALLSARNIDKLKINKPNSLRIVDVLGADKIVVEKSALDTIQGVFGPKAEAAAAPDAPVEEVAEPVVA